MPTRLCFSSNRRLLQLEADRPSGPATSGVVPGPRNETPRTGDSGDQTTATPRQPTRFYGSVKLDPARLNRDAAQVSAEVVQHLASLLNAEVELTLEIQAKAEGGIPDNIARTVSENCKTLKFLTQGFEND